MKKALVAGALGLALTGAAAVPVQSAFGNAAQRQAQRCAGLVQTIQTLRAEYDSATDPNVKAMLAAGFNPGGIATASGFSDFTLVTCAT